MIPKVANLELKYAKEQAGLYYTSPEGDVQAPRRS